MQAGLTSNRIRRQTVYWVGVNRSRRASVVRLDADERHRLTNRLRRLAPRPRKAKLVIWP
jgi:hypothetical protein